MPTLLDTLETPAVTTRQFGAELQASMAAVRLQLKWFGTSRSVANSQKHLAADMFDAESKFVTMDSTFRSTMTCFVLCRKSLRRRNSVRSVKLSRSEPRAIMCTSMPAT